jgi:hypothetical protein
VFAYTGFVSIFKIAQNEEEEEAGKFEERNSAPSNAEIISVDKNVSQYRCWYSGL